MIWLVDVAVTIKPAGVEGGIVSGGGGGGEAEPQPVSPISRYREKKMA